MQIMNDYNKTIRNTDVYCNITITGLHTINVMFNLRTCGTVMLEERCQRGDLIEAYKMITGKEKARAEDFFNFRQYSYDLWGYRYKLETNQSHLQDRRNYFSQWVVDIWNWFPSHLSEATTVLSTPSKTDSTGRRQGHYKAYQELLKTVIMQVTSQKGNWPKAVKKLLWLLQIVTKFGNYFAFIIIHINCICHVGDRHRLLMWQLPGLEFWSPLLRPCRRRVDIASAASADRRHVYVTHWRRFRGRAVQNRFIKC